MRFQSYSEARLTSRPTAFTFPGALLYILKYDIRIPPTQAIVHGIRLQGNVGNIIFIYLLTAVGLSPVGSTHLHTQYVEQHK
jgi:hypothetical protein